MPNSLLKEFYTSLPRSKFCGPRTVCLILMKFAKKFGHKERKFSVWIIGLKEPLRVRTVDFSE